MKIIKGLFMTIASVFRLIYKIIDKFIIIPITKIMLVLGDKFGSKTDR